MFLVGDVPQLRSVGALLVLFLVDRWRISGRAEKKIRHDLSGRINLAQYLSPAGFSALEFAADRVLFSGGNFYLYLFSRLSGHRPIEEALIRLDVPLKEFSEKIDRAFAKTSDRKETKGEILDKIGKLALSAFKNAIDSNGHQIEPRDVFVALSGSGDSEVSGIFQFYGISGTDLENALAVAQYRAVFSRLRRLPASLAGFLGSHKKIRHRIMNRAWTSRPTPFLDKFSRDITDLARSEEVGFLIGHRNEYDRLVDVLSRPGRPNVLLVGESGAGKSTLAAHLAFEIIRDRVPAPLFDKRLVELEIGGLSTGASEGELRERVQRIINEIIAAGNIILYIPDIHNLLRTAGPLQLTAADILIPAIKSDAFSVIGATYPREYKQYLESNGDFAGSFEMVRMQEISEAEAVRYLTFSALILEKQYRIAITHSALKQAVGLAIKYFHQKLLPSCAEDLLKEAVTDAVGNRKKIITGDEVISVAEKKVNIPIRQAGKEEAGHLLNLEKTIHGKMIDQEEAVKAVANSLREYRSGLSRKGGPIASFLFVGPTGVGKTQLAKILAEIQFGSSEAMARLDMSEYQEKNSISRLIGSSDGSSGGILTDAIVEKPYRLILLDEFEKAHPDILNIFLQVFDDGRLTDATGKTVDFKNTIIICTSNAHSDFIKTQIESGSAMKTIAEQLKKKLSDHFKPELLNRFSDIVVFQPLSPEHIRQIAGLQLADLAKDLLESRGIGLSFGDAAIKEIARLGYDPVVGARPLRNVISEKVKGLLAEKILKGEVKKGDNIQIDFRDGVFGASK